MVELVQSPPRSLLKAYCSLVKPGIIMGNALTMLGGFALASSSGMDGWILFVTFIGLSLIIGSSCVFNNVIDRETDQKMERTRGRPLARGDMSVNQALYFGIGLWFLGFAVLFIYTNLITLMVSLSGFAIYVFVYSYLKYYTVHGTLIGSVAGATPPLAGYAAAAGAIDSAGWILFLMIALWQMPHFFAIAIYRLKDYKAASIPILPAVRGVKAGKKQTLYYAIAFVASALLLPFYSDLGVLYLTTVVLFGGGWLAIIMQGHVSRDDTVWAKAVFMYSLLIVTVLSFVLLF